MSNELWVVAPYFNFCNDPRRAANLTRFLDGIPVGVPVCLVELVEDFDNMEPRDKVELHVVHTTTEGRLWCKEALINIGVAALPPSCTKVCWMDADVQILDPEWAANLSAALDAHPVAQPFAQFVDLPEAKTPADVPDARRSRSFAFEADRRAASRWQATPYALFHCHPGYAWAARRDFLDAIGGLFAHCILGHGDLVMAAAFSGHLPTCRALWGPHYHGTFTNAWSTALKKKAAAWQFKVVTALDGRTVGVLPDTVLFHWFHGTMAGRNLKARSKLLAEYDPDRDVVVDEVGMLVWSPEADPELRAQVAGYFEARASSK